MYEQMWTLYFLKDIYMIKLTRGALTMLLAQYRGILKNAWIKNFAVAAALATTVTSAYAVDVTTCEDAV